MQTKLQRATSNIAEIVIVVAILIVLNWIGYYFYHRFDLTSTKMYTLSQATKRVLASLDDPVNVEVFMSTDLPPQMLMIRDEIRDKLAEYVARGGGRFKLRYTDPGDDEEQKERAINQGVQELRVNVTDRDEIIVKNVFFGLVLNFEDKSEALPALTDPTTLEYELTSRLVRMTLEEKPKVGLFIGPFTTSQQQQVPGYDALKQVLGGQGGFFEMVEIDAQTETKLPEDLDGLILCGTFGLSDSMKYSIDQFLLGGGQVIVSIDPMMEAGQMTGMQQSAYPSLPTIEDQLEKYGVRLDKKLVADRQCAQASMRTGFMIITQPYQLWPMIGPEGFNKDVAAVAQLETLIMPYTCPLEDTGVEGVTFKPLAQSSSASFTLSSPFDLSPDQDWAFLSSTAETTGPYTLACLLEGAFATAFADGPPAPRQPPASEEGEEPVSLEPEFDAAAQLKQADGSGRLVVLSSGKIFSDDYMNEPNSIFLANVVEMMVLGDQLLGIRSTPVTARPLKELTDAQKQFYRWMNVLGVPILLVLFGMLLWFLKGRRRIAIQQRYGG